MLKASISRRINRFLDFWTGTMFMIWRKFVQIE